MYDWPEIRNATDGFWSHLRAALTARGVDAPPDLQRPEDPKSHWVQDRLVFSQTCGYPLVKLLGDRVRVIATPIYDVEGCEGSTYRSAILVRGGDGAGTLADLRGRRAVANGPESQSGYSAFRHAIAAHAEGNAFFADVRFSGTHRQSILDVAAGKADVCAVDAVCWSLAREHLPDVADKLRVLGWTAAAPSLPFICSAARSDRELAALRSALADAVGDAGPGDLRISGVEILAGNAYDRIAEMEDEAVAHGYAALA